MIRSAAAFLLLVSPAAGASQTEPPQPATPDAAAGPTAMPPAPPIVVTGEKEASEDEKLVCESREETGSLFRKRVCRTVAQNEEASDYARSAIAQIGEERERRQQTQESICPTGPGRC